MTYELKAFVNHPARRSDQLTLLYIGWPEIKGRQGVKSVNKNVSIFMSHCTTHSFEIICRGWKVGLADHMMRSLDIRYNVSYMILHQGVDSLAQWLQHLSSTPAIRVRIPSGTWDVFKLCIIS